MHHNLVKHRLVFARPNLCVLIAIGFFSSLVMLLSKPVVIIFESLRNEWLGNIIGQIRN